LTACATAAPRGTSERGRRFGEAEDRRMPGALRVLRLDRVPTRDHALKGHQGSDRTALHRRSSSRRFAVFILCNGGIDEIERELNLEP
jgi:hypothetical protein